MSDVFWAQMERGWKRRRDGTYQVVTPSIGSLLQAAAALRLSEKSTDELLVSAGHEPLPRRYVGDARPLSVVDAIEADPALLDEAREHLLNQYELLLRVSPPKPSEQRGKQIPRRATTQPVARLEAVAEGGDPAHRAEMERRAREARVRHPRKRTEESHGDGR